MYDHDLVNFLKSNCFIINCCYKKRDYTIIIQLKKKVYDIH